MYLSIKPWSLLYRVDMKEGGMGSFMQSFPMWGKQYLRCYGARVDYGDLGSIPGTLGKVCQLEFTS